MKKDIYKDQEKKIEKVDPTKNLIKRFDQLEKKIEQIEAVKEVYITPYPDVQKVTVTNPPELVVEKQEITFPDVQKVEITNPARVPEPLPFPKTINAFVLNPTPSTPPADLKNVEGLLQEIAKREEPPFPTSMEVGNLPVGRGNKPGFADPAFYIPVRLTNGDKFYKALDEFFTAAGGQSKFPFVNENGKPTPAVVISGQLQTNASSSGGGGTTTSGSPQFSFVTNIPTIQHVFVENQTAATVTTTSGSPLDTFVRNFPTIQTVNVQNLPSVTSVSGTQHAVVDNFPTVQTVQFTAPQNVQVTPGITTAVSGTLTVTSVSGMDNTNVNNFPTVQTVVVQSHPPVSVTSMPANTTISGTVLTISGSKTDIQNFPTVQTVNVQNLPGITTLSGSQVDVKNFPTVQTVNVQNFNSSNKLNLNMSSADFYPGYNRFDLGGAQIATDPAGSVQTRGAVLTDEGSSRVSFTGSALFFSPGTATFVNGSNIVNGSGFSTTDIHYLDYIKLGADGESAWAQIYSILSDTQILLASNYAGAGGSGTYNASSYATVTGTGATISVASGQLTIAAGTNTTSASRSSVYKPFTDGSVFMQAQFSISQRVANQDIYFLAQPVLTSPFQFSRFHFTGTDNTQVLLETAYNPTTTPSSAETQTNSAVIPNGGNTSTAHIYKIEQEYDQIIFSIDSIVVGINQVRIPHTVNIGFNSAITGVQIVNSGAITNTNVIVDFMSLRNFDRLDTFLPTPTPVTISGVVTSISGAQHAVVDNFPTIQGMKQYDANSALLGIPQNPTTVSGTVDLQDWLPVTYSGQTNGKQLVSASSGKFGGYYIYNPNSSVSYMQIFDANAAANVTLGTTQPKASFGIPATSAANLEITKGLRMQNGIVMSCTTTAAGATAPTTGLDITLFYR